jgi:arylsulfatase A-like enzyme
MMGKGVQPATKISAMIQNIDIAPTILTLAGEMVPGNMDGQSFESLLQQKEVSWRDTICYEYFWERHFPQTPTVYAIRTNRYKYIRYHGVWDTNEFYDLQNDPNEMNNLIRKPEHQETIQALNHSLFKWLEKTKGMSMPLRKDEGTRIDHKFKETY